MTGLSAFCGIITSTNDKWLYPRSRLYLKITSCNEIKLAEPLYLEDEKGRAEKALPRRFTKLLAALFLLILLASSVLAILDFLRGD